MDRQSILTSKAGSAPIREAEAQAFQCHGGWDSVSTRDGDDRAEVPSQRSAIGRAANAEG